MRADWFKKDESKQRLAPQHRGRGRAAVQPQQGVAHRCVARELADTALHSEARHGPRLVTRGKAQRCVFSLLSRSWMRQQMNFEHPQKAGNTQSTNACAATSHIGGRHVKRFAFTFIWTTVASSSGPLPVAVAWAACNLLYLQLSNWFGRRPTV